MSKKKQRLLEFFKKHNITYKEIAKETGYHPTYIRNILNGHDKCSDIARKKMVSYAFFIHTGIDGLGYDQTRTGRKMAEKRQGKAGKKKSRKAGEKKKTETKN